MKKILIMTETETNKVADERFSNNGGGYHQPEYTFTFSGVEGVFSDTSCGDFGSRYFVTLDDKGAYFGSMLEEEEVWTDFMDSDADFLAAFKEEFGISVPTVEEVINW